jgi:hypothetical protein
MYLDSTQPYISSDVSESANLWGMALWNLLEGIMAKWILQCPVCGGEFTHSQILESHPLHFDSFAQTEIKPGFPDGGMSVACPSCCTTCVYQRYQLIYRES